MGELIEELLEKLTYYKTVEKIILQEYPVEEDFEYSLIFDFKERYGELYPLFCETVKYFYERGEKTAFQAVLESVKFLDRKAGIYQKKI